MSDPAAERPQVALVTGRWGRRYAEVGGSPLEGRATVTAVDWPDEIEADARAASLDEVTADADALLFAPWFIEGIPPFTEERWENYPRLRVIAGTFDNRFGGWLSIADARARGVTVIDTSRSMTPTVAEFALAMTMNLLLDIPAAIQTVRDGGWREAGWDHPGLVFGDLTGRTVGLAGYGSINRRYAELLGPFRCTLLAHDPFVAPEVLREAGIESVASLEELSTRSEILSVGIPPTPATLGVISAAVDVFEPEPPPPEASFRTSPYVLPTPHIAGNAAYCHRRCFTTAAADALAVLRGEEPVYRATPHDEKLYTGDLSGGSTQAG